MATEIRMPRLMDTMTLGGVVAWRKHEGDSVHAGEVIAEVEVDKTTVDLESPGDGTLTRILVPAGAEKVDVGCVLALIDEAPSSAEASLPSPSPSPSTSISGSNVEPAEASSERRDKAASPLARSMAHQAGLDLATLSGSGPGGRVVRADVARALGMEPGAADPAPAPEIPSRAEGSSQDIPHSRIRRLIAERLGESKRTIPHFYLEVGCAVDELLRIRAELASRREAGLKPSINDFAVRAAALALREVPEANAVWTAKAIRRLDRIDLAVAVATDAGLVAPVVRDADQKGLRVLTAELHDLADRARSGRLRPEELSGGTFTLSNLGMYGIDALYAIINPPQAGILGLGAATERPVVRGGSIAIATMMTCTLSADHRVIDGAAGARLLAAFKGFMEQPLSLLV